MSAVQMPTPPEGHYWKIGPSALVSCRRVYLMRRLRWWFDIDVDWELFELSADEHENANKAAAKARRLLDSWSARNAGFNGLTGYVDHKGVTR